MLTIWSCKAQSLPSYAVVGGLSAAPYYYTGTYTGTNTRETCRSINTSSVTISGTTRETNTAYQSIILDGSIGTVTISPTSGGSVEFKIK